MGCCHAFSVFVPPSPFSHSIELWASSFVFVDECTSWSFLELMLLELSLHFTICSAFQKIHCCICSCGKLMIIWFVFSRAFTCWLLSCSLWMCVSHQHFRINVTRALSVVYHMLSISAEPLQHWKLWKISEH